jgi:hypothetical protein
MSQILVMIRLAISFCDQAEFLDSTPMKGRFVNAMVNEISHRIQRDPQLHQMMAVEELTFATTLHYDNTHWSRYMLDKGFTRIRELGDLLYDGKLASIIFPININGVHWTVFLVDVKNREIHFAGAVWRALNDRLRTGTDKGNLTV